MLVSDATLDRAREALERLHVTSAQVQRMSETIGADGSVIPAWSNQGSPIACRVETDMGTTSGRTIGGAGVTDRPVYDFTVFAAHDADIRTGDRLVLSSGLTLSVMQASRGQSQPFVSAYGCTEAS